MVIDTFHQNTSPRQLAQASLLGLLFTCMLLQAAMPLAQAIDALSGAEQTFFSHDYAGEPVSGRLDRLESSVFGSPQNGTDAERTARLLRVLNRAKNVIPSGPKTPATDDNASISPTPSGITRFNPPNQNDQNTSGDPDNADNSPHTENTVGSGYSSGPKPSVGESDYPTVTALEREVFSRDFLRDDISRRLDRLEAKAFGQPSPNMALSDRMDRLLARYPHAAGQVATYAGSSSSGTGSSAIRDLPSDSRAFVGQMDTYTKVGVLEKRLFNGKTFDGELLTQRLDRLETKSYGRNFSGQSIDMRVNRLLGAYKTPAKNNLTTNRALLTQPDPAKWQSPSQVGYTGSFLSPSARPGGSGYSNSYTPGANPNYNGYNNPYPAGGDTSQPNYGYNTGGASTPAQPGSPPQNIQIGGGFSSSGSSTYNFSPDMMAMLPPGIQQQLGGGGLTQQQSATTVVGAPGTVITQETTSYPGFQTYGGAPVTTYNYYGPANGVSPNSTGTVQLPGQSTVTVIQPNGMPTVIQNPAYPGYSTGTGTINGLPTPVYVGDPAVLQGLNNLEMNLYGQVNPIESVPVRLSKLETVMLGQVYMGYPDDQRLGQLQKAYQMQSVGRLLGKGKAANIGRTAGSMLFGVPMNMPTAPKPLIPPSTTK